MMQDPRVWIETVDPQPEPEKLRKIRWIAQDAVRRFLNQNHGLIDDLNKIIPEPPPELVSLVLQTCAGAVVFGATQALDLNAVYSIVTRDEGMTDEEFEESLAVQATELKLQAAIWNERQQ